MQNQYTENAIQSQQLTAEALADLVRLDRNNTFAPICEGYTYATSTPTEVATGQRFVAYILDSPAQRAALELFDLGFNIGPTRPANKVPYRWRVLVGARIDRSYIPELFDNGAGLFVLTGRLSMNLAIDDCDTFAVAEMHAQEFERRGLHPWRVNTAHGAHFWFLSSDGELANITGDGWQLWGSMHYCLCPPSIHPTGMIYEWSERSGALPPSISLAALDWLHAKTRATKRKPFDLNLIDTDPLSVLSKRNRDFIKNGAPESTRNIRLFAAACDMAGNRFAYDDAIDMLTSSAVASGLTRSEAIDTIKKAFRKNREPAKKSRSDFKPLPTWGRALEWANTHQWQPIKTIFVGRDGKQQKISVMALTARAVFVAMCERSRRDSSDVFRATRREVAELANVDSMTAHRAIIGLTSCGFIVTRDRAANGAALFAFGRDVLRQAYSNTHGSDISVTRCNTRSDARSDVFRVGALGKMAETVWLSIMPPNSAATKAEIARRAGCHRSTVTRILSADGLPKWGLASQLDDGRWMGNSADDRYLSEVAIRSGTSGKAEKRREKHAEERSVYASKQILNSKRWYERRHMGEAVKS